MRGNYSIEAERTTGDRCIVVTLDGERHSAAAARAEAENELLQPGVYRILVYRDTGDTYTRLYTIGPR